MPPLSWDLNGFNLRSQLCGRTLQNISENVKNIFIIDISKINFNYIVLKYNFNIYRVSLKKGNFSNFRLISVLEVGFYFFHMWFGIRISSPFHLATQIISLQNLKCAKNAKKACAVFPALRNELRTVSILHIGDQKYSCTISVLKMFSFLGEA